MATSQTFTSSTTDTFGVEVTVKGKVPFVSEVGVKAHWQRASTVSTVETGTKTESHGGGA